MLFKEIIGNSSIKTQLLESVKKNRVSHAQLFFGNTGSAKLALALAYAQYLNCENKTEFDSCGDCFSCLKHNNLTHPDLHLIFPVLKMQGSKTAISDNFVDKWRSFVLANPYASLNDWSEILENYNKTGKQLLIYKDEADVIHQKLLLKNFESPYRAVVIWMPEKMNLEASNKLLKLFEEPPKGIIFLLISNNPNKLLPTITSRLQKIKVPDFTHNDISTYLKKGKIGSEKTENILKNTTFDLGKIHKIENEQFEDLDFFEQFASWMRLSYKTDIRKISKWVDEISLVGRKHQQLFLSYAIKMARECLIFNFANHKLLKTSEKEQTFIKKFAPFIHEENSILIIEALEISIKSINRNANAKILFFELSLQIIRLLKVKRKLIVN
tara:strand:- start:20497 stop:21648 length:1152 start_codon:yes stop_codon:yes gene_type:complete